jgi:hypothetical protein
MSLVRLEPEASRSSTTRLSLALVMAHARLAGVGFVLALSAVPGALAADALCRALASSLAHVSLQCERVLSDERGLTIVMAGALGPYMVMLSFTAAGFEVSSKVARFVPHAVLWCTVAVALVFSALAAGITGRQSFDFRWLLYCVCSGSLVLFLPQFSYELWRLLTRHKGSPLRLAPRLVKSMLISAFGGALATGCACYVMLSQRSQGVYSVLVNGALGRRACLSP